MFQIPGSKRIAKKAWSMSEIVGTKTKLKRELGFSEKFRFTETTEKKTVVVRSDPKRLPGKALKIFEKYIGRLWYC